MFILDLFRNCVDRTANMRSFIDRMTPKVPATATTTASSRVIMVDLEPDLESELEEEEVQCLSGPYQTDNHSDTRSGLGASPLLNNYNNNISSSSSSKKRKSPVTQGSIADSSHAKSKTNNMSKTSPRNATPNDTDTDARRSKIHSRIEILKEKDKKEAASAGADAWICAACTYCHRAQERQYLQCAVCACSRPALSSQL